MVVGVYLAIGVPTLLQAGQFAGKAHLLLPGMVRPAALGLVMYQFGPRLVECLPAPGIELEAQIDIVECNRKAVLVKPPNCEKFLALHNQTGPGSSADELPPDAKEYGDLELYLTSLSNGLKLSVPGIRP